MCRSCVCADNGGALTESGTLRQFTERGHTVWKLTTPQVLFRARERFGCASLNGTELEEGGGTGTSGSHWDHRIFMLDMMAPQEAKGQVYDNLTLAYMYDSGWYMVDYAMTSASTWGRGKGCAFAEQKCLTPGNPPTPTQGFVEWCATPGLKGCD